MKLPTHSHLLASKDETLLRRWNTLLLFYLLLDFDDLCGVSSFSQLAAQASPSMSMGEKRAQLTHSV